MLAAFWVFAYCFAKVNYLAKLKKKYTMEFYSNTKNSEIICRDLGRSGKYYIWLGDPDSCWPFIRGS